MRAWELAGATYAITLRTQQHALILACVRRRCSLNDCNMTIMLSRFLAACGAATLMATAAFAIYLIRAPVEPPPPLSEMKNVPECREKHLSEMLAAPKSKHGAQDSDPRSRRALVCLSATPIRLPHILPTIKALSTQAGVRQPQIVISLPLHYLGGLSLRPRQYELPAWLTAHNTSSGGGVFVQRLALDLGPIDKLRGCLAAAEQAPNGMRLDRTSTYLVITDDDYVRGPHWMAHLLEAAGPNRVGSIFPGSVRQGGLTVVPQRAANGEIFIRGAYGYAMRLSDAGSARDLDEFAACVQAACKRTDDVAIAHYLLHRRGLQLWSFNNLTAKDADAAKGHVLPNSQWTGLSGPFGGQGVALGDHKFGTSRQERNLHCDQSIRVLYGMETVVAHDLAASKAAAPHRAASKTQRVVRNPIAVPPPAAARVNISSN